MPFPGNYSNLADRRETPLLARFRTPLRQPNPACFPAAQACPPLPSVIRQRRIASVLDGLFFCFCPWDSCSACVGHSRGGQEPRLDAVLVDATGPTLSRNRADFREFGQVPGDGR